MPNQELPTTPSMHSQTAINKFLNVFQACSCRGMISRTMERAKKIREKKKRRKGK
jgi:hypothetical protein